MSILVEQQIREIAFKNKNVESCGLIIGEQEVYPCRNIAEDKKHRFKIHPQDYLRASLKGKITGCFHTHVGDQADFSMLDRVNSMNQKLNFILYHLPEDRFYCMEPAKAIPYMNRPFVYGKTDCYNLVVEYYKNELQITLPVFEDYTKMFKRWAKPENFQIDCEKAGLKRYNDYEDAQKHDIFVFNFYNSEMPPHFAVFLGNGFILHHPRNGYSQVDLLSPLFLNKFKFILRHASV